MDSVPMEIKFDDSWAWVDIAFNQDVGSDLTLLTVGDSWTWGDELGGSSGLQSNPISNTEYRLSKCFGNLLSQRLNANWVQLALPSGSNEWITTEAEKLCHQIAKQTKQLIIVVNFSDHGRELNDPYSTTADFYRELFEQEMPITDCLRLVETTYYKRLSRLAGYENVQVIANSTFTQTLKTHKFPDLYQPEKTWLELLCDTTSSCYMHTTGAWELNQFLNKNDLMTDGYKQQMNEIYFPAMENRTKDMKSSPFLLERCHPNEQGHEIWAEYLYNYIKNFL